MLQAVVKSSNKFPANSKMLIFGGGFSGQHIANVARQLGVNVLCSRRDFSKKGTDFIFDSKNPIPISKKVFEDVTHILSCIPPSKNGEDPVLSNLSNHIKQLSPKWVGYLSTTGVYGDRDGAWVNEESLTKPKQQRSISRLSCEKQWEELGLPLQILRLPGIYGPGRSTIDIIKGQKNNIVNKPGQVFSRIHVDDIAGAIMHLIDLFSKGIRPKIINISDNLPATNVEVMSYAAHLLKVPLPPIESFEIASKQMSPMALSFWKENRRVSNKTLCKELGYKLIHEDYKTGLKDCLDSINSNNAL